MSSSSDPPNRSQTNRSAPSHSFTGCCAIADGGRAASWPPPGSACKPRLSAWVPWCWCRRCRGPHCCSRCSSARGSVRTWIIVGLVMGPGLFLCVIGARMFPGWVGALLLGVMSGSLWGVFTVLTKGVVDQLGHGIPALLRAPELYVWAVLGLAATAWEQSAFRAGSLTASLPAVTVAEPIVGSVLGVTVLGETLNTNNIGMVAIGVSVAVMIAATVALAHSQATRSDLPRTDPV